MEKIGSIIKKRSVNKIMDAMMSKRVYRNALSAVVCRREIEKIMYDQELTKVFIGHFDEIADGLFVEQITA